MNLAQARAGLHDIVHSPVRLAVLCLLSREDVLDFQTLMRELDLSYALLSKHTTILERAGYLVAAKRVDGARPSTQYRLTGEGRRALEAHLACLERLERGREDVR